MRYFFFLVFLLSNTLNSQEYLILNEADKTPLPFVHIDFLNGTGTTTDENGKFMVNGKIDSIEITSLGFKTLNIKLSSTYPQNEILLQENAIALEGVSLLNKKSKLLKHKGDFGLDLLIRDFTHDEKVITFIPFPDIKNDSIIIKSIAVNTTGLRSKKRRYYPFKVNLYKAHTKYRPPFLKDSLLSGIITSRKKNKPSLVKINIEEYNIPMPLEGVYVSFETLEERFYPKDSVYEYTKKFGWQYWHPYNAAAVKTIKLNKKRTKSYSYYLVRKKNIEISGEVISDDYWQLEKKFIYDITLEIKY